MAIKQKTETNILKVEFISFIAPDFQAAFEKWIKGFPVDLIKSTFTSILKGIGSTVDDSTGAVNYEEFKYAVMFACFSASNYSKEKDNYIANYQRNIDCLKSVPSQKKLIYKINKFLDGKAAILDSFDSELSMQLQNCGISFDKNTWGFRFRLLKDVIESYERCLDNLKLTSRFSIGCLKYYEANNPKNTPTVESMLAIQLAVYFNGVATNQSPWLSYNRKFEVDIPMKIKPMKLNTKQAIADLVEYSLKTPISTDSITDILNKRIKPRMKLCPWSVIYHS